MSCCCISFLGYAAAIYLVTKLACFFYRTFYPFLFASPIKNLIAYSGADWAVVTGSTDGIGKSYAIQLAKKGFNIVLVARNDEKLKTVKQEIEAANGEIEVRTLVFDFTESSPDAYKQKIGDKLEDVKVGVLVNNVGMGVTYPEYFCELENGAKGIHDMVVVNCLAATLMSHLFLPSMVSRNKGVIINISSASACIPMALMSVYSASKIFVSFLTRGLQQEYKHTGVFIQSVTPFYVISKLSKLRHPSFFVLTPDNFVRSALGTVGIQKNTFGCLSHALQAIPFEIFPSCLSSKVTFDVHKGIRAKALKRKAEKSE